MMSLYLEGKNSFCYNLSVNFSLGRGAILMNEMIQKMKSHTSVRKYKKESVPKNIIERMVQADSACDIISFCSSVFRSLCNR